MKDKELSPTAAAAFRTATVRMAEPSHRLVPQGASTGQSIRSYPKSCIDQVRDVCLFYVKKCSGKYEDNVTAARYVHQMADEVISLLAGVAGEIRRNKSEPEVFQALLDEWNEHFPPSLGAMGSPKAIATIIANQTMELNDLKTALDVERSRRDKDVSEILRSMEAQLQAYRNSVVSERRHQAVVEQQRCEQYENTIADLRKANKENLDRLAMANHNDLQQMKGDHETQLATANRTIDALRQKLRQVVDTCKSHMHKVRASKDKKFDKLLTKYKTAQEKYYQLACMVQDDPSVLSSASFGETTIATLSHMDLFGEDDEFMLGGDGDDGGDEDEDDDTALGVNNDPDLGPGGSGGGGSASNRRKGQQQGLRPGDRGYEESKAGGGTDGSVASGTSSSLRRQQQLKGKRGESVSFGPITATKDGDGSDHSQTSEKKPYVVRYDGKLAAELRIKFLLEQIDHLKSDGLNSAATIEELRAEIAKLREEIAIYLCRLKELESMNEALRCNLAMAMNIPAHPIDCQGHTLTPATAPAFRVIIRGAGAADLQHEEDARNNRNIRQSVSRKKREKTLCHTPHFLGPVDTAQCMSNHPVLSPYNTAGYF